MTETRYYYVTTDQGYAKDGWVTEMGGSEYIDTEKLEPGKGFYLVAQSGKVTVQYAGEVKKGTITVNTIDGYNIIGNSTPVPLNLQNIKLIGEFVGDGATDYIEVWTKNGAMTETRYYYVTVGQGYDKDGWVTEMGGNVYPDDVIYQPGQGFFLVIQSGAVQVEMPGAID